MRNGPGLGTEMVRRRLSGATDKFSLRALRPPTVGTLVRKTSPDPAVESDAGWG